MQYLTSLAPLLSCISAVAFADALTEFASLRMMVDTVSRDIAVSISIPVLSNLTSPTMPAFTRPIGASYNTSQALDNITSTLAASTNNYNLNDTAFVNGTPEMITDPAYQNYINLIPTLGQALQARGRAWHSEENLPIYQGMQILSQHIYTYGQGLTARGIISTSSTIRTITASGSIIDAQDAWASPGFLPGAR